MKIQQLVAALASLTLVACSGGSSSSGGNSDDPLSKLGVDVSVYDGNASDSKVVKLTGTTGVSKSNRPIIFGFTETNDAITKVEMIRKIDGVTTTCPLLDKDGKVRYSLSEFAAKTTDFTVKAYTAPDGGTNERSFGPYTITVEPAGVVVSGDNKLYGQAVDSSGGGGGAFWQTRLHATGMGGYTSPNFNSDLLTGKARLADFGLFLTTNSTFEVISPDLTTEKFMYPKLANECGYLKTTFALYTGPLNPKNAPLTAAEITALPDPAATATTLAVAVGDLFVYKTSDGKKGLIRLESSQTMPFPMIVVHYSVEQ